MRSCEINASKPTPKTSDADDPVWSAMNDASRRHMLDLLRRQPMTTKALCTHFGFSRFNVMKHLKVLEAASLIVVERQGRERLNHLNPVPLQSIYRRWIQPFEALPADRLLRLKELAEQTSPNTSPDTSPANSTDTSIQPAPHSTLN